MLVWKEFMKAKYLVLTNLFVSICVFALIGCGSDTTQPSPEVTSNSPPVASAGNNQTVDENTAVTLDASASSDSDGSISSYQWSQTAGTAVALSASNVAMPTFTAPTLSVSETLTFQVTVTDNDGATNTSTVNIVINPINISPIASAGSEQTVDAQSTVTLNANSSSDEDGTIVSFFWEQTAGIEVTLSDTTISMPTFTAPQVDAVETLSFQVSVTDNIGASASAVVNVFVNPISDNTVPESELEASLFLNELYFEYTGRIGEKIWVLGFFGNTEVNNDGAGYLVENMLNLDIDEEQPHHSFARLDGAMPPDNWHGNQILVYGEIKDFATVSGNPTSQPTPLISVEKYLLVSEFEQNNSFENTILPPDLAPENTISVAPREHSPTQKMSHAYSPQRRLLNSRPGTQAQDCDRSVIISGGIDESANYSRYQDNVIAKFNKMKELGFSDDQIEIFYNNGTAIDVNGTNAVDEKASKVKIMDHLMDLAQNMPGSCTLTIFVTDHGTGFNSKKSYRGARPALSGPEATNGMLYDENTFVFDARAKTYRVSDSFVYKDAQWIITKEESGRVNMHKRVGEKWVLTARNSDDDTIMSEAELGIDLNDDGNITDTYGITIASLEQRLSGRNYRSNEWDTDRDGSDDVRVRWDGSRFVVERLDSGEWKEMGRDTNGDYFIDIIDGGVDWNLDGDKADQIGFHEGINLWGNEVLWDDEFAEKLKALSEKGIHVMVEMVSCYSGGFTPNLGPYVENIYTGSSEDTPHINRKNADGKYFATDEIEFLNNLQGIDTDSWNAAADAATAADDALADAQNATRNIHVHEQTTRFETGSMFDPIGDDKYNILLDLPDDLVGQIYDFEFILGLQNPRWSNVTFPNGLPSGLQIEDAPGGIRVFSENPISDDLTITIEIDGATPEEQIRIEFTDVNHKRLGYTMLDQGSVLLPDQISIEEELQVCVNHTDHGDNSSPSIMEWLIATKKLDTSNYTDIALTIQITTPDGTVIEEEIVLNDQGRMYLYLNIFVFGNYEVEVVGARHVPTEEALFLLGQLLFPFSVTAEETNKGQCSSG
jgi:hypothetical protein